jgi:PPM family protein phosphatase
MIRACYLTNIGKIRTNNEDSLLVHDLIVSETNMNEPLTLSIDEKRCLFIVADGMGGHAKGELASRVVLEVMHDKQMAIQSLEDIPDLIELARKNLNELVTVDKELIGLGSTAAGIIINDDRAFIFNCGDSRVYKLNGKFLEKITHDHSIVQNLVDSGEITEDEMRTHPRKNIITSAIMGDLKEAAPESYLREISVHFEQCFLLCSDGVWEGLSIDDLEQCFNGSEIKEKAIALYSAIINGEAQDNFSFIIIERIHDEQC